LSRRCLRALHFSDYFQYLTTIQIVQFMIGLAGSVGALVTRLLWMSLPEQWGWGAPCNGSWTGSWFGLAVVLSYLVLFIQLYNEKYKSDALAAAKRKAAAGGSGSGPDWRMGGTGTATPGGSPKGMVTLCGGEYRSTFSPRNWPDRGADRSTAPGSAAVAAALGRACPEDAFAAIRARWLSDPLVVADRERAMQPRMPTPGSSPAAAAEAEAGLHRRTWGTSAARL